MSDDLVDRLRAYSFCPQHGEWCGGDTCCCLDKHDWGPLKDAAAEIVRLRARVTELEAENRKLGESGAVNHAQWKGERALADQLAEALDDVLSSAPMTLGTIRDSWFYALVAHVAARKETS